MPNISAVRFIFTEIYFLSPPPTHNKMKTVTLMLKAIHAQESKEATREKAIQVAEKLQAIKLAKAAKKVEYGIKETLTQMDFLRSIGPGFGPITLLRVSTEELSALQKQSVLFRMVRVP